MEVDILSLVLLITADKHNQRKLQMNNYLNNKKCKFTTRSHCMYCEVNLIHLLIYTSLQCLSDYSAYSVCLCRF